MITAISLENFKCFKGETQMPTKNFNLLTGINGRGKSTALQPLLLIKQSIEINEFTTELYLNGFCVELGNFDDVKNNEISTHRSIKIGFNFSDGLKDLSYSFVENIEDEMSILLNQLTYWDSSEEKNIILNNEDLIVNGDKLLDFKEITSQVNNKDLEPQKMFTGFSFGDIERFNTIHFVSADRLGPQEFYLKKSISNFLSVGVRGENVVNVLLKKKNELIDDKLYISNRKNNSKKNISKDLISQTAEWLNEIFDGGYLDLRNTKSKIANILFNTTGKAQDEYNKPSNIGFGFSYALPIIISGLIAKEGEILIVENPEAHLHPRAQSRITKFLAKVSQCGVQVFIETHSDHVLNASRIAVLDKIITKEQLNILYFSDDEKNQVVTIPVKEDGGIEDWPDGFFDQTDKDYERLFGL